MRIAEARCALTAWALRCSYCAYVSGLGWAAGIPMTPCNQRSGANSFPLLLLVKRRQATHVERQVGLHRPKQLV